MGKPTTRKPASSSMENSCISREAHVWREALFICVCVGHGIGVLWESVLCFEKWLLLLFLLVGLVARPATSSGLTGGKLGLAHVGTPL